MHDRNPGLGVAEQLCGQFDADVGVDCGRYRASEYVRGHPLMPAPSRTSRSCRRTFAVVSGAPARDWNGQVIQPPLPTFATVRRTASVVRVGMATTRVNLPVLGWSYRKPGERGPTR